MDTLHRKLRIFSKRDLLMMQSAADIGNDAAKDKNFFIVSWLHRLASRGTPLTYSQQLPRTQPQLVISKVICRQ